MSQDPDQLMTAEETSEYLRVPVDTLYAWKYKGYGPKPAKVGRHLRYRLRDVDEWIDGQVGA
jgi:excisionase family DNA binding protein